MSGLVVPALVEDSGPVVVVVDGELVVLELGSELTVLVVDGGVPDGEVPNEEVVEELPLPGPPG